VDPLWVRREEFQALEALVLSLREEVARLRRDADTWGKATLADQSAASNLANTEPIPAVEPHRPSQARQNHGQERPRRPSNHRAPSSAVGGTSQDVKQGVHRASPAAAGELSQEHRQHVHRAAPAAVTEAMSLPERPLLVEKNAQVAVKVGSVRERVAVFERSKSAPPAPHAQAAVSSQATSPRKAPELDTLGETTTELLKGMAQILQDGSSAPSSHAGQRSTQAPPAHGEPLSSPSSGAAVAIAVQDPVALRASHTPKKPRRPGMSPCASPASPASSMRSNSGAPSIAASAGAGVEMLAVDGKHLASADADFQRACCDSSASSPKSLCSCPPPDFSSVARESLGAGSAGAASDAVESDVDDPQLAAEAHRILAEGILQGHVDAASARSNRRGAEEATPAVKYPEDSALVGASSTSGAGASSQLWSSVLVPVSLHSTHSPAGGQHARGGEATSGGEQQRNLWSSLEDAPADSLGEAAPATSAAEASSRATLDSSAARRDTANSSTPEPESAAPTSDLWSSVADVVVHSHLGDSASVAGAGAHAASMLQPSGTTGSSQWSSVADVQQDVAAASASSIAYGETNADSATEMWSSVADIVMTHGLHCDVAQPTDSRSGPPELQTPLGAAPAAANMSGSESNSPGDRGLWSSASDTAHVSSASAAETPPSGKASSGRLEWMQRAHNLEADAEHHRGEELDKEEDSLEKLPVEEGDDEVEDEWEKDTDEEEEEMEEYEEEDNEVNPLDRDGLSTEGSSPAGAERPQTTEVRSHISMRHYESSQASLSQVRVSQGNRTVVDPVTDEVEDMEVLVVEDSGRGGEAVRLSGANDADLVLEDMEDVHAAGSAGRQGDWNDVADAIVEHRLPRMDEVNLDETIRCEEEPMAQTLFGRDNRMAASAGFSPPPRVARAFTSEPHVAVAEPAEEAPSMELWDSLLTDIQDDVGSAGLPLP